MELSLDEENCGTIDQTGRNRENVRLEDGTWASVKRCLFFAYVAILDILNHALDFLKDY